MEWVYDNRQKEKEILNAYLERFTFLKGIGICSQSIIRKRRLFFQNTCLIILIKPKLSFFELDRCNTAFLFK